MSVTSSGHQAFLRCEPYSWLLMIVSAHPRTAPRASSLVPKHPEDQGRIEHALAGHAAQSPPTPAVVDAERSWSYATVAAMVAANAERLRARGLAPGDRVVVFLDKSIECVVALYAVWTAGAIAVSMASTCVLTAISRT